MKFITNLIKKLLLILHKEKKEYKILSASEKEINYENFIARCPYCSFENVFNRITDFKSVQHIDSKEVQCFNKSCLKLFNINGDLINPAFEMFLDDCLKLIEEKRYMYCVLNIAQAYESFFNLYLHVELLYKVFNKEKDIDRLNQLTEKLFKVIKTNAYKNMRNIFIRRVLEGVEPQSFNEAEQIIDNLKPLTKDPSNSIFDIHKNHKLIPILKDLKNSNIDQLRNKVVHKIAYRPSLQEVLVAKGEADNILEELSISLGIRNDDLDVYVNKV